MDQINHPRRRFLGTAAGALAAAQFAFDGVARAQPSGARPALSPPHTSFAALKQVDAGLLSVGYAEAGPADGPAVILLHGWPYDIHSFVDVAPPARFGRLPRDRPLSARLRHHPLPLRYNVPQRPACGACERPTRSR